LGEPALLFLHYWGGSARTGNAVTSQLSTKFRCIADDQRGWGQSDAPEQGYSIRDLAMDVKHIVEALHLRRYVLVGHSMGGKVVQSVASQRPPGSAGLGMKSLVTIDISLKAGRRGYGTGVRCMRRVLGHRNFESQHYYVSSLVASRTAAKHSPEGEAEGTVPLIIRHFLRWSRHRRHGITGDMFPLRSGLLPLDMVWIGE
jgi:pimeloyl-ACP methyl ester carboxylesterase